MLLISRSTFWLTSVSGFTNVSSNFEILKVSPSTVSTVVASSFANVYSGVSSTFVISSDATLIELVTLEIFSALEVLVALAVSVALVELTLAELVTLVLFVKFSEDVSWLFNSSKPKDIGLYESWVPVWIWIYQIYCCSEILYKNSTVEGSLYATFITLLSSDILYVFTYSVPSLV